MNNHFECLTNIITSMTPTYTPTLMEKLLGKQYKWWVFIKYRVKRRFAYRINNLFFSLGEFLTLVSTISIWILASNGFSPSLNDKFTYFIFGTIFYLLIYHWPSYDVGPEIRDGRITNTLLLPQNTFTYYWFRSYFFALVQGSTVISLILLASPIWYSWVTWPSNLLNWLLLLAFMPIAITIKFFTEMIVACFAFWSTEIDGLMINYTLFTNFFSGRLFPLNLIIGSFFINLINIFAFLFYHPMQIYLGKYDLTQTLLVFTSGIAWCFVLWLLAKWIFHAGLKRNESVGL